MPFEKIREADLTNKGVVGQQNTPQLNAREMQEKVEEIPRKVIIPFFNALIDALNDGKGSDEIIVTVPDGLALGEKSNLNAVLAGIGAEILKRVISDDVKKIRVNEYGELEVSKDGREFTIASSRGHVIMDGLDTTYAQRRKLRFKCTQVEDDPESDTTVVYGLVGPAGPVGPGGIITKLSPGLFGMTVDENGDLFLQHNNGEPPPPFALTPEKDLVYKVSPDVQINLGNVKGEPGQQGPAGKAGTNGLTPRLSLEVNGDLYVTYE